MSPVVRNLHARLPWDAGSGTAEEPQKDIAPRTEAAYDCERGHPHPVVYAAEAVPPPAVWYRCGGTARLPGVPRDAVPEGSEPRKRTTPGTEPMAQLRKRRGKKEGAAILAEALERVRQSGATR